jgi:hypothetical protein
MHNITKEELKGIALSTDIPETGKSTTYMHFKESFADFESYSERVNMGDYAIEFFWYCMKRGETWILTTKKITL